MELNLPENPITAFQIWLNEAIAAQCAEPTAMTLATASKSGVPSARIVLFKGLQDNLNFKFFTNYTSPKAHDLEENPLAALVFLWTSEKFQRQVRVSGQVSKLTSSESFNYYQTRKRGSQLGAWSSPQSQKVASRAHLEKLVAETEDKFGAEPIPLPPFWGGYALTPRTFEFWEGREFRIHERFLYESSGGKWTLSRLAP